MRRRGLLGWAALAVPVVLVARALAYALEPSPLAVELGSRTPGPKPLVVGAVALGLALLVSAAAVWLAALGVRERHALTRAPGPPPRLRAGRLVLRAAVLFATSSLAFALVESTLHWRAGLGFHGLHCLLGPVHRDALPLLAALSALASSLAAAAGHLLAWMRRTLALLRRSARLALAPPPPRAAAVRSLAPSRPPRAGNPRGPPWRIANGNA